MSSRLTVLCLIFLAFGVATASPTEPIDQLDTCLGCHGDLTDALELPVQHAPVAGGECSACHNPHVARFEGLLREHTGTLCVSCHGELSEELQRAVVHSPVAQGECLACHVPHGGSHDKLVVRPGSELCAGCHAEVADWRSRPVQHAPFDGGDCSTCHEPHAADHEGLSSLPAGERCLACHEADDAFTSAHGGYPVETADCGSCHDPHASARAGMLRERLHAPFEGGDCSTCHGPPGAESPFAVVESCGSCHEEQTDLALDSAFPHLGPDSADCVSCHNPHTANGAGMLDAPQQQLCVTCHDPGGAGSGEEGRHLDHGDGLDCTTCHAPHGAELPRLFAQEPIELCSSCHSHQHSVAHPMGADSLDPRNGQPIDCLTCHGLHDAPHPKYLHQEGNRELCVGCHKRLAGGPK